MPQFQAVSDAIALLNSMKAQFAGFRTAVKTAADVQFHLMRFSSKMKILRPVPTYDLHVAQFYESIVR